MGDDYIQEMQPSKQLPAVIYINMSLVTLNSIDTMDMKFRADINVRLRWYDDRIHFRDLNDNPALNRVGEGDLDGLWVPRLSFVNALGPYLTIFDELSSVMLVKETAPLEEDFSSAKEGENLH